jgi:hypothetical protein
VDNIDLLGLNKTSFKMCVENCYECAVPTSIDLVILGTCTGAAACSFACLAFPAICPWCTIPNAQCVAATLTLASIAASCAFNCLLEQSIRKDR